MTELHANSEWVRRVVLCGGKNRPNPARRKLLDDVLNGGFTAASWHLWAYGDETWPTDRLALAVVEGVQVSLPDLLMVDDVQRPCDLCGWAAVVAIGREIHVFEDYRGASVLAVDRRFLPDGWSVGWSTVSELLRVPRIADQAGRATRHTQFMKSFGLPYSRDEIAAVVANAATVYLNFDKVRHGDDGGWPTLSHTRLSPAQAHDLLAHPQRWHQYSKRSWALHDFIVRERLKDIFGTGVESRDSRWGVVSRREGIHGGLDGEGWSNDGFDGWVQSAVARQDVEWADPTGNEAVRRADRDLRHAVIKEVRLTGAELHTWVQVKGLRIPETVVAAAEGVSRGAINSRVRRADKKIRKFQRACTQFEELARLISSEGYAA